MYRAGRIVLPVGGRWVDRVSFDESGPIDCGVEVFAHVECVIQLC